MPGDRPLPTPTPETEHFWAGALRRAVVDGDVENGSMMAGQSVGMVKSEQSTAEIIRDLVDQAAAALARRGRVGGEAGAPLEGAAGARR